MIKPNQLVEVVGWSVVDLKPFLGTIFLEKLTTPIIRFSHCVKRLNNKDIKKAKQMCGIILEKNKEITQVIN